MAVVIIFSEAEIGDDRSFKQCAFHQAFGHNSISQIRPTKINFFDITADKGSVPNWVMY